MCSYMMQPKITIVTVVYNDVGHIEKTIQSVLSQSYKNIEYIIIDGGSSDGTVDIIKKYNNKIAFWVSEKDGGIYEAMNKGVCHASGDWINFMNSGDYFYNENVIKTMFDENNLNADLLYGSYVSLINNKRTLVRAYDNVFDNAWLGMRLCHQALFARTELLKNNKFDIRYRISADGDFVNKCIIKKCKFKKVDCIVFEVGTFGYSQLNFLSARKENWLIARKYFPSLKTDLVHLYSFVYFIIFRFFKRLIPANIYNRVRNIYRKSALYKSTQKKYNYQALEE